MMKTIDISTNHEQVEQSESTEEMMKKLDVKYEDFEEKLEDFKYSSDKLVLIKSFPGQAVSPRIKSAFNKHFSFVVCEYNIDELELAIKKKKHNVAYIDIGKMSINEDRLSGLLQSLEKSDFKKIIIQTTVMLKK